MHFGGSIHFLVWLSCFGTKNTVSGINFSTAKCQKEFSQNKFEEYPKILKIISRKQNHYLDLNPGAQ